MLASGDTTPTPRPPEDETALQEILGYLNFSNGKPDPRFQQHLNRLARWLTPDGETVPLQRFLEKRLAELQETSPAFRDSAQAAAVLSLLFNHVIPAYKRHHSDLLFHLRPEDFLRPFFVARVVEATLAQGGPWGAPSGDAAAEERSRVVSGALRQLNDYLGHRPIAVLETGQQMQPYDHERFRPVPLYIRGAGAAAGKYHDLIEATFKILAGTPREVLAAAYFDPSRVDELALDVRAYDHSHPVFKRTNYTFGEWDPHCLDNSGYYRRFVVRSIILDALYDWMDQAKDLSPEEKMYEASAVLAGTMLMASSVSGAGPDTHNSNVSLTSLLPKIARQRDAFYLWLLESLTGTHATRLRREAEAIQQPFGKIRQHLNLFLAHYGCRQMQRGHLAYLYAKMGFPVASREQATIIPSTIARFETEIHWRITVVHRELDAGHLQAAAELLVEVEDLLLRGIACGALVDPWNILGFQGQFPLFMAREDSVADQRVEALLGIMEQTFGAYARICCEAAAAGANPLKEAAAGRFRNLAEWWDKFATPTVADLPQVFGMESYTSAAQVAHVLGEWSQAGEAAGDIAFWKKHLDRFESTKSYAIVVDVLLRKRDIMASMSLLIQWLSDAEHVGLENGPYSFHPLVLRWMDLMVDDGRHPPRLVEGTARATKPLDWPLVIKFFDYVEVNAGSYLAVPKLTDTLLGGMGIANPNPGTDWNLDQAAVDELIAGQDPDVDDEETLFSAAYDNVTFRDSAQDGNFGDTVDQGSEHHDSDLDLIIQALEPRMRFLVTLAELWEMAAARSTDNAHAPILTRWFQRNESLQRELGQLVDGLALHEPAEPSGDPDSLIEYDRQLHVKLSLMNSLIGAQASFVEAGRTLRCALPEDALEADPRPWERTAIHLQRVVARRDRAEIRRLMPGLIRELVKRPLLYIPLDKGGNPRDIVFARGLQALLRRLLTELPRLGLMRETWHLLKTAFVMERTSPPSGMSITEFDRLLHVALKSSLECLIHSARAWPADAASDQRLVELVGGVTEAYLRLWLKHSATMRLSSLESLSDAPTWRKVKAFIKTYGAELFHPRMLTLGNLRAVVQRGVDSWLDYFVENVDPLHPVLLIEDLNEKISREEAVWNLDLIFRCVVEKFDRFMEYNTTTTQSDYGDQLYCLLDFLRLEAGYERQAWNLTPLVLAHEVLLRNGQSEAATIWRMVLQTKTSGLAKTELRKLKRLERQYGVRLPSITDRLSERFIKPLSLDRILALVHPAMQDADRNAPSPTFERLQADIEKYLATSSGSALEIQPWLQSLEEEIHASDGEDIESIGEQLRSPEEWIPIDLEELREDLTRWEKPLNPE